MLLTKTQAHGKVMRALYRGELIKPKQCSGCGMVGKTEGHHTDYSRPLDVLWLCRLCHKKQHFIDKKHVSPISRPDKHTLVRVKDWQKKVLQKEAKKRKIAMWQVIEGLLEEAEK